MQQTHAELLRDLTGVSEAFTQLSERLADVASELRTSGIPPSPQLLKEIAESRNNFDDLRNRAVELMGLLPASEVTRPEEIGSLKELKALLQSLSEAEEKRLADQRINEQALSTLDRVLSFAHREGEHFQPLLTCQAKARELRAAIAESSWPDMHPEAVVLAQRRHPFAELLTLVEEHDRLDDDLWLVLKHAVSESFGKKLSLAAARGKLIVSDPIEPRDSEAAEGEDEEDDVEEIELDPVAAERLGSNGRTRGEVPERPFRATRREA